MFAADATRHPALVECHRRLPNRNYPAAGGRAMMVGLNP
jgi:hypothetical protein